MATSLYFCITNTPELLLVSLRNRCKPKMLVSLGQIALTKPKIPSLSFLSRAFAPARIEVVQESNGLLLCDSMMGGNSSNLIVANPSRQTFRLLPQPQLPLSLSRSGITLAHLFKVIAYDPEVSAGYLILVRIFGSKFLLYSSHKTSWETLNLTTDSETFNTTMPFYWNQRFNWVNLANHDSVICDSPNVLSSELPDTRRRIPHRVILHIGCCRATLNFAVMKSGKIHIYQKAIESLDWELSNVIEMETIAKAIPQMVIEDPDLGVSTFRFKLLQVFNGELDTQTGW